MLKIKELRTEKKLTQDEVVRITGIPKRTYVSYERGEKDIPFTKLRNIANSLGVSIAEITGDSEITQQDKEIIPLFESKTIERMLESQELPLYDGTVTAGVVELLKNPNDRQVIGTLKIPNMPKCDGAVTVTGDSMYPLIKSGDIVFFKTINDIPQSIYYGNMYLISLDVEGDELVMVKYIQKGNDENHLLLVSQNQHHADKEVHIRQINAMALVKGNIRFNFTS